MLVLLISPHAPSNLKSAFCLHYNRASQVIPFPKSVVELWCQVQSKLPCWTFGHRKRSMHPQLQGEASHFQRKFWWVFNGLSGFLTSLCSEPGWKLLHSSCARASNLVISCASPWHFKSSCHASGNWEDHVRSSVVENHATLSIAAWHMRRKTSNCACMLGGYFAIPKLMQLCEGMRGYVNICWDRWISRI